MGKTIVFFNLADKHQNGLAKRSVDALKAKYPRYSYVRELIAGANQVHLVDLFKMLEEQRHPIRIDSLNTLTAVLPLLVQQIRERIALGELCQRADKIMIGVHGHFGDTDQGHAGMGWDMGSGVVGTFREFARLIATYLHSGHTYRIALVMCFGARAERFRVDHDGELEEQDIKSSFAYKFYKELCQQTEATVILTARTGSVEFDSTTGRSLVQTEAAAQAEMDDAELQAAKRTEQVARSFEQLQVFMSTSEEGRRKFREMKDRMEAENPPPPRNPAERIIANYVEIRALARDYQSKSGRTQGKYGKFVYQYDRGRSEMSVFRKYEGGAKVMRVLYRGAL